MILSICIIFKIKIDHVKVKIDFYNKMSTRGRGRGKATFVSKRSDSESESEDEKPKVESRSKGRSADNRNINVRSKLAVIIDMIEGDDLDEQTLRKNVKVSVKHLKELLGTM
jgi:hypothetical protein